MKKLLLISLLIGSLNFDTDWFEIFKADYFVNSETGSDSNSGLYPWDAWQTISKVNSTTFAAGDRIGFNGTFSGTITVGQSGTAGNPITFKGYGDGATFTGFTTVTGFTKRSNTSVYKKYIPMSTAPEIVTINGVQAAMGRTPNSNRYAPAYADYYHIDSENNTTTITDSECNSATTNWTGAELVVRTYNGMNWARCPVTNHSSTTLTITNSIEIRQGWGYFIQNDLRTLDQTGEWYFNNTTDTLYVYFSGNNPDSYTVKISTNNTLIDVNTRDYITVKNLNFDGANQNAIETNSSSYAYNLTIDNCDFLFNNRCVYANSAPNLTVKNCSMVNNSFMAIYDHWDAEGATISNNVIDSTGLVIGVGQGEGSWYQGISLYCAYGRDVYSTANNVIENNTIKNSGYMGITAGSDSARIRNNFIDKYNLRKSDGGAIYLGTGELYLYEDVQIDGNICLHGTTSKQDMGLPADSAMTAAYSIYLDNNTNGGTRVTDNTVAYTQGAAIMVHMSEDITITGNKIFDCGIGVKFQQLAGVQYEPSSIRTIDMQNNVIVAKQPSQKLVSARSLANDFDQFGTINHNKYAKPVDINPSFITMVNTWAETLRDSAGWRTATTWDANSTIAKYQVQNEDSIRFYYNETNSPVTYLLSDTLRDAEGTAYNTSITLQPYTSAVLWNDDLPTYTKYYVGTQTVGGSAANSTLRTAMPITMTENGYITAIWMYTGGQAVFRDTHVLLGLYNQSAALPGTRIAVAKVSEIPTFAGWVRCPLVTPVEVTNGTTVWMGWIFERSTQAYYTAATPGRAITTGTTWSEGMPSSFGSSTQASSKYSMYAEYVRSTDWQTAYIDWIENENYWYLAKK